LYGRVFPGLTTDAANLPAALGANHFLRDQLADQGAQFARIYGFSYEGAYYALACPALFVVHGPGTPAPPPVPGNAPPNQFVARGPSDTDRSGEARNDAEFSSDIMYWEYDKGDFSLRLDVTAGTFEDILLESEIEAQFQMSGAGRVQTSGAGRVQSSGAGRVQMSHAGRMQMAHRSRG
jgi:hypothetical protein